MNAPIFSKAAQPVETAIIPVAGLGTRTYPASLGVPKNLLPAGDRPLIQHAVEEALDAGCKQIVLICNPDDEGFYRRHFDHNARVEQTLINSGKTDLLNMLHKIWAYADHIEYVPQQEARGLGHAVRQGAAYTNGLPFAVILPDDYILPDENAGPCLRQMVNAFHDKAGKTNILAVMEVPLADTNRYGIMQIAQDDGVMAKAARLVEKPKTPNIAGNSRLAVMGRYVLQPEVMALLEHQKPGAGNEIQLTDSLAEILKTQDMFGLRFKGQRFDYGTIDGRMAGEMALALHKQNAVATVLNNASGPKAQAN